MMREDSIAQIEALLRKRLKNSDEAKRLASVISDILNTPDDGGEFVEHVKIAFEY
jgi:hypothetical protein